MKTQDVSSQLTAQKTSHQTGGPVQIAGSSVQNRKDGKEMGIPGPWFIALYGSEEDVVTSQFSSSANSRPSPQSQVVDIQGLGLNDYIILDSQGKLHLLTLQDLSEEQKIETLSSNFLSISHLRSSMQVSSFAVLPPPPPLPHIPGVTFSPIRESGSLTFEWLVWHGCRVVHCRLELHFYAICQIRSDCAMVVLLNLHIYIKFKYESPHLLGSVSCIDKASKGSPVSVLSWDLV